MSSKSDVGRSGEWYLGCAQALLGPDWGLSESEVKSMDPSLHFELDVIEFRTLASTMHLEDVGLLIDALVVLAYQDRLPDWPFIRKAQ